MPNIDGRFPIFSFLQAGAKGAYITPWHVPATAPEDTSYCNYCDETKGCVLNCDNGTPGTYCAWGWKRTLTVLGAFNYYFFWMTSFAACSWWAEGGGGGMSDGV